MTKEEKLKKIKEILNEGENEEIEEIKKAANISKYALVLNLDNGEYQFMYNGRYTDQIDPQILACTVGARILGAIWAAVDSDGNMYWYPEEPIAISDEWSTSTGHCLGIKISSIPCKVDDWKKAKWKIR